MKRIEPDSTLGRLGIGCEVPPLHGKRKMQTPLQVTFEGCESSEPARAVIEREVARLEEHNKRIVSCRVSVIAPSDKHRHGNGFQVHIWLTIPPHENIVVDREASGDPRHEHVEVAIKDAFAAARRQVDDRKPRS
jgi:ribosome-associated translation inhibitor RaiA